MKKLLKLMKCEWVYIKQNLNTKTVYRDVKNDWDQTIAGNPDVEGHK